LIFGWVAIGSNPLFKNKEKKKEKRKIKNFIEPEKEKSKGKKGEKNQKDTAQSRSLLCLIYPNACPIRGSCT